MSVINALKRRVRIPHPFAPLYAEANLPQEIRQCMIFVIFGNLCGNLFGTISTGSALTGYAERLGANDFIFGVLTAIPFIGTLSQLPAALLISRSRKRKIYMLTYGIAARTVWLVIGLVPYFAPPDPTWLRIWTVIILVGIAAVNSSFINIAFTSWLADLVPIQIRGRWLTRRDRVISIISVIIGLITARILDAISGYAGYTIVFIIAGTIGIIDMLCFIPAVDPPMPDTRNIGLGTVWKGIIKDKPFMLYTLFWTVWLFTSNMGVPYILRYAIGPLSLTYMQVTIFGQITTAVVTVVVISKWGYVIDRYGSRLTLLITCAACSVAPVFMLFAKPGGILPFFAYNIINALFASAANLAAQNMLMHNSPAEQRPAYIAVYTVFASIAGAFLGVLTGGALLQWLSESTITTNVITGTDYYKIVFLLCVVIRLIAVFILVPKLKNEYGLTLRDMKNDIIKRLRGA